MTFKSERYLELTLWPSWRSPLITRLRWTRFSLCQGQRTRTTRGGGWDHDMSWPRQVPAQPRLAALALEVGPWWPGGQLAVHWTVHGTGHLGVSGLTQMVAMTTWHRSTIATYTALTTCLDPGPARGVSGGATRGPVRQVPRVAPARGVGHAGTCLLQWRTHGAALVRLT